MKLIDLSGRWRVRAASRKKWVPASVPGCIHTDLMEAGIIPDPFLRDHEGELQWIGREAWIYEREFDTPRCPPEAAITLCCDGLDTLATVMVNGEEIGRADNMHRNWRFDLRGRLNEDVNTLTIRFDSPLEYIEQRQAERALPLWPGDSGPAGRGWIRKMASQFGWDWAPSLVTCGIWRGIGIEVCEDARVQSAAIRQIHDEDGGVALDVAVHATRVPGAPEGLTLGARLTYKGTFVTEARTLLPEDGNASFHLKVRNAQLWWPNGLGDQPLYELTVDLTGPGSRKPLDTWVRRIGLRTLRLNRIPDGQEGERLEFVVNGVPFFAKGANWISPDALVSRPSRVEYARLAKAVSVGNMNMLRVWGGGIYEQDWFYDLCDEYGICVWQDFMFACPEYPVFDAAWLENVRAEAAQNIVRLRDHACLALWCGNNEYAMETADTEGTAQQRPHHEDYARLFDDLLPSLVAELDPGRDYWPVSPHGSLPGADTHADIQGWDADAPAGTGSPIPFCFRAAFGPQSFPEPSVIKAFTQEETCDPASPLLLHHQRFSRNCPDPEPPVAKDPEQSIWLSQLRQAFALKHAVEQWRRARPQVMGVFYQQLNDCWPAASWSSLDHEGNWEALHYFVRKFYAPIMISSVADPGTGILQVFVHNDLRQRFKGSVTWRIGDTQGRIMRESGCAVTIAPGTVRRLGVIKLGDLLERLTAQRLVVWLSIVADDGYVLSSNSAYFAPPRDMQIFKPDIQVDIRPWDDHCYAVTLTTERPAFWCWLEVRDCNARYDENFIHLPPNQPCRIRVTPLHGMRIGEFREALRIRSIWDVLPIKTPEA